MHTNASSLDHTTSSPIAQSIGILDDTIPKDLEHLFPNRIVVRIGERGVHDIAQTFSWDLAHDDHKEVPAGAGIAIVLREFGVGYIGGRMSAGTLTGLECRAFVPEGQNSHLDAAFFLVV